MVEFIEIEHPGVMLKEDFLNDLGVRPGTLAAPLHEEGSVIRFQPGRRSRGAQSADG